MKGAGPEKKLPPIDASFPGGFACATFTAGSFFEPEAVFGVIEGVLRTRVGYSGGMGDKPTGYEPKDHSETLQVDFDAEKVAYGDLLDIFFRIHNPFIPPGSRQYMSTVFYHDDEQRCAAAGKKKYLSCEKGEIYTGIYPLDRFYAAEDYLQKHYLQQSPLLYGELRSFYPDFRGFRDSTAAARINGYLAGCGTLEVLKRETESWGLSAAGAEHLINVFRQKTDGLPADTL